MSAPPARRSDVGVPAPHRTPFTVARPSVTRRGRVGNPPCEAGRDFAARRRSIGGRSGDDWPGGSERGRWATGSRILLAQVIRDLRAANGLEWAAALACYTLLSLFPLLLAGLAIASSVGDAGWAEARLVALLGEALPSGGVDVESLIGDAVAERGRVGILSLIIFLVTGRRVLGALTKALNLVSDVDESTDPARR